MGERDKKDLKSSLLTAAKTSVTTGFKMGGEVLRNLHRVAKEKSLSGKYITESFLDLIFYPTIKLVEKDVKVNKEQLTYMKDTFLDSTIAIIIL